MYIMYSLNTLFYNETRNVLENQVEKLQAKGYLSCRKPRKEMYDEEQGMASPFISSRNLSFIKTQFNLHQFSLLPHQNILQIFKIDIKSKQF